MAKFSCPWFRLSRLFDCAKILLIFLVRILDLKNNLFFNNFNFCTPLFCKNSPNFCQLGILPFQKT